MMSWLRRFILMGSTCLLLGLNLEAHPISPLKCKKALMEDSKDQLSQTLRWSPEDLTPRTMYWVQLKGEAIIRELLFEGFVPQGDTNSTDALEFSQWDVVGQVMPQLQVVALYRLKPSEIHMVKAINISMGGQWNAFKSTILLTLGGLQGFDEMGKLMFMPYPLISKLDDSVEIRGTSRKVKAVAQDLAIALRGFDESLLKLGFQRPSRTRLVVNEASLIPNLVGPFTLTTRTWNLSSLKSYESTIAMSPINWNKKSITDESILFHERMHSILYATYSEESYVNTNPSVQEALADFGASHRRGSPVVGDGFHQELGGLRNLSERTSIDNLGVFKIDHPMDAFHGNIHGNSLLLSHALWKVREAIGAQAMDQLLKPLIDDLNRFRGSYQDLLMKEGRGPDVSAMELSQDLEYLLAVLLRTGLLLPEAQESLLGEAVMSVAEEMHFNPDRVAHVAGKLKRVDHFFEKKDRSDLSIRVRAAGVGISGFLMRFSALYMGMSYFLY